MPDAHDVEPVVSQDFAAGDLFADSIDKNLAATARQTSQTSSLESFQHGLQRQFADLCEVMNLRRTESMNVDLREMCAQRSQRLFVPFERQFWMQSALQQNLVAAKFHCFFNLLEQRFNWQQTRTEKKHLLDLCLVNSFLEAK